MNHILVIHSAGDLSWTVRLRSAGFRFSLLKKQPTAADDDAFDRVVDHDYQEGIELTLQRLDDLHAEDPIHGVVSVSESGVIMAAIAAAHLQLPGHPPAAALRARNKYLMRVALRDAGLPCPAFQLVRDASETLDCLHAHAGPMVLKPLSGSSSYGVTRLDPGDNPGAIAAHLADVRRYIEQYRQRNPQYPFEFWLPPAGHGIAAEDVHDPATVFLLEGFLPGQQVSVDGFVCDGRVTTCGVIEIERIKDSDYFLEAEEWMPTRLGASREAEIQDVVERAVAALGLRNGPFHCELKVDPATSGPAGIHVLEIAARRGADNIADFLQHVAGVDIYEEMVRIACGQERVRRRPEARCHMRMRYFLPDRAGRLAAIEGAEQVRADERVSELVLDLVPGDEVLVPPDGFEFFGYVSVHGPSHEAAAQALDEVHPRVRFEVTADEPIGEVVL